MHHRLMAAGIRVVKLNGGMAAGAREAALSSYNHDVDVVVILISLKAGSVALNLTVASHIYLMDPWWNPAAEYQAMYRRRKKKARALAEGATPAVDIRDDRIGPVSKRIRSIGRHRETRRRQRRRGLGTLSVTHASVATHG